MGWNTGYEIFEQTVVGAYDLGVLSKELLAVLMEPYRDTDIDSGGRRGLLSKDGKGVEQIVVETFGKEWPVMPDGAGDDVSEDVWDRRYDAFQGVSGQFGW